MLHGARNSRICAAVAALALVAGLARAESRLLVAHNDPHAPNYFTISFPPEFGGDTTADIVSTHFAIRVDDDQETASILNWYQLVNPLNIAGHDTGDITVVLAGDSEGAYNEELDKSDSYVGQFRTSESYAVHFTGDLSDFGITSPFVLPGASTGFVKYDDSGKATGRISMSWSGQGDLGGIPFTYVCAVNAVFDTSVDCSAVKRVRASCRQGTLRGNVTLSDASHDGQVVTVLVKDTQFGADPIASRVESNRAKVRVKQRSGQQTVGALGRDGECGPSAETSCD